MFQPKAWSGFVTQEQEVGVAQRERERERELSNFMHACTLIYLLGKLAVSRL